MTYAASAALAVLITILWIAAAIYFSDDDGCY